MNEKAMDEIAFFGKVTASITHEIQNVLSIIKESSGLIDDVLSFSGKDAAALKKNLKNPCN